MNVNHLAVHFYLGNEQLVDIENPDLRPTNKAIDKKLKYFHDLDLKRSGSNYLEMVKNQKKLTSYRSISMVFISTLF